MAPTPGSRMHTPTREDTISACAQEPFWCQHHGYQAAHYLANVLLLASCAASRLTLLRTSKASPGSLQDPQMRLHTVHAWGANR